MILQIKANPNSSINQIVKYEDSILHIKITTPPVEGKVNSAIVKYLAKLLHIPKTSIIFLKGEKSKIKLVEIPLTLEEFNTKIENFIA